MLQRANSLRFKEQGVLVCGLSRRHDGILSYHGGVDGGRIRLGYASKHDLKSFIQEQNRLDLRLRLRWMIQLAESLSYYTQGEYGKQRSVSGTAQHSTLVVTSTLALAGDRLRYLGSGGIMRGLVNERQDCSSNHCM